MTKKKAKSGSKTGVTPATAANFDHLILYQGIKFDKFSLKTCDIWTYMTKKRQIAAQKNRRSAGYGGKF